MSPPRRRPLKDVLDGAPDEAAMQRMWRAISAPVRPARSRAWVPAAVAVAVVVGALGGHALWSTEAGPLRRIDGAPITAVEVASSAPPDRVELEDRSRWALGPGTRLEPLENTGSIVVLHLIRGRGDFVVAPGGGRRWVVECGLATVEVVAAQFSIARTATRVEVSVASGLLLIRGERVPDRVRPLRAGDSIVVDQLAPGRPGDGTVPATDAGAAVASSEATRSPAVVVSRRPRPPPSSPPPSVAGPAAPSVDELLAAADDARRRGDPRAAAEVLERVIAQGRADTLTALASFTLGRIRLVDLGEPARARAAFERALLWPLPLDLREDALAYLAESCARAGDAAAARTAAARYLREHPRGRQVASMRALVGTAP